MKKIKRKIKKNKKKQPQLTAKAIALFQSGNIEKAEQLCRKIIRATPREAEALHLLGLIHIHRGDIKPALKYISDAITLAPATAHFYNSMAEVSLQEGFPEKAIEYYQKAITLDPGFASAYSNLGVTYAEQGNIEKAAECYLKAVTLNPKLVEAQINLGGVYVSLNKMDAAIQCYQKALKLQPGFAEVYSNLGNIYRVQGKIDEAVSICLKALELKPGLAMALNNLGTALEFQGKAEEAAECYRKAIRQQPDYTEAHSNLLLCLNYLNNIEPAESFKESQNWEENQITAPPIVHQPPANEIPSKRPLRIGYVSADFRAHPVASFMTAILESHNRSRVEVYCYADIINKDRITARLEQSAHRWVDISGMPDHTVVQLIRNDRIDILIDLAGHTADNRLKVFAMKPAPIQVAYLGYPNTTGLSTIDYRVSDSIADPVGLTDPFYSETIIRLPGCFLCYTFPDFVPDPTKALQAKGNTPVTFGTFNKNAKISSHTIKVWSDILHSVPESRLFLKFNSVIENGLSEHFINSFGHHGINKERLIFQGRTPKPQDLLALYNKIDIALDTFPYNGTTTTFEAIMMGVPVVVLEGNTHAARVGASIMANLELHDLIGKTEDEYKNIATSLANNATQLSYYKSSLRHRMEDSPLTDGKEFTTNLENEFLRIWDLWRNCKTGAPQDIPSVEPPPKTFVEDNQTSHHNGGNTSTQKESADCLVITIADSVSVCIPPSIELLTPYVLLEQEDWFEDEITFLRQYLKQGMNTIDIGANYGMYSLSMAHLIGPEGKVWAFEPASSTVAYLYKSIARNQFNNITVIPAGLSSHSYNTTMNIFANAEMNTISTIDEPPVTTETIQLLSLDECAQKYDWQKIEFIKLDAEGEETKIITGGNKFFSEHSPLIMFELKHGDSVNNDLIKSFQDLQYTIYRLIPGLHILAPFNSADSPDLFQLNLFCCKKDRAEQLEQAGFLAQPSSTTKPPVVEDSLWKTHVFQLPYGKCLKSIWKDIDSHPLPGWDYYKASLNYYVKSHNTKESPDTRYNCILNAISLLNEALKVAPNMSRLQTLARVLHESGQRSTSNSTLKIVLEMIEASGKINCPEPFLPVSPRYDSISPNNNLGNWCHTAIIEQHEKSRAFSSYFAEYDQRGLALLENLKDNEFVSPEIERRRQLIKLRHNLLQAPEKSSLLVQPTPENMNPDLWNYSKQSIKWW